MATTLMTPSEWAATEFASAQLGDRRRANRLIKVATGLAQNPNGTLPGSFGGWAETKATYRLLAEPDVEYEQVLDPHRQRVRTACENGEYLQVEDTTSLNFSSHQAATGLGRIGNDAGRGLYLHTTLALRIERWSDQQQPQVTTEGLFHQQWWARRGPSQRTDRQSKEQRLSRKRESARWAAVVEKVGPPPQTAHWTYVADREGDIYEVLARCQDNQWHWIIRACQARALADRDGSVFTAVSESDELGRYSIDLRARPGQRARRAQVAVKAVTVHLRGPWRPGGRPAGRTVNVVQAEEITAGDDVKPVHWVLLTDWPVDTFEQAMRVINAYCCRWLIEEYHKALKSGTRIEDSQLSTAARLTALLAILAVVAVRLLNIKLLAKTRPDEPVAEDVIGPEALTILAARYGKPPDGWTNAKALRAVGRMGGFLARKSDGDPGWQTIWRGLRKLMEQVEGYDIATGEKCG